MSNDPMVDRVFENAASDLAREAVAPARHLTRLFCLTSQAVVGIALPFWEEPPVPIRVPKAAGQEEGVAARPPASTHSLLDLAGVIEPPVKGVTLADMEEAIAEGAIEGVVPSRE